jgi:hypothetical protein
MQGKQMKSLFDSVPEWRPGIVMHNGKPLIVPWNCRLSKRELEALQAERKLDGENEGRLRRKRQI